MPGEPNAGLIGSLDRPVGPMMNTEFQEHMLAHFVARSNYWHINGEPKKRCVARGRYYPGAHTFRIVLGAESIDFHVDGAQVGRVPNCKPAQRRFYIAADAYTSHYGGWLDVLRVHSLEKE